MRAFRNYISKHLVSFAAFLLALLFLNIIIFGLTFQRIVVNDYGDASPQAMLKTIASAATPEQLSDDAIQKLRQHNIWAIYLNLAGQCFWSVDLPDKVPESYTIQDVALFSKGYIEDYPVFVWNTDDGLLVLGYPKNSYTKLISNYYSISAIKRLPIFVAVILGVDILCLFLAYYFSKCKIIQNTEPIIAAVEALADGKPVLLHVNGELSELASSINKASSILIRQNEARANWISGVSHDIRTPLSIIMGYADHIAKHEIASDVVREQAEIMRRQSIKIKELVQDLNLVSQLAYEMQPLHKEMVRLSKLLRTYMADLLNMGISDKYTIEIAISPNAENVIFACDARLLSRAINNLVQNSIRHNLQGCEIYLSLEIKENQLILAVVDNGTGISAKKLQELEEKPHYMDSTNECLGLRHGLGLLIVQQIAAAHDGIFTITNLHPNGCKASLSFPYCPK